MGCLRHLTVLVAIGTGLVLGATGAFAQATCEWYSNTALQQQKLNVDRKCGFKGQSWSFDRTSHMQWCQSVSPDQWKREAQFRDKELAKCAADNRR